MGRKNRRKRTEYQTGFRFDLRKYMGSANRNYSVRNAYNARITGITRIARTPKRGDIWFADLGSHPGTSVQGGCRPVLVVSNDIGNNHAETINVLPLTKHLKKPELPCHTQISPEDLADLHQFFDDSMILAEQITTISKLQLRNYVGRVENLEAMSRINTIINRQLDLDSFEHEAEHGSEAGPHKSEAGPHKSEAEAGTETEHGSESATIKEENNGK